VWIRADITDSRSIKRQVSLPVAELAVLGLLATGPDAGVEAGLFLMKAAAPLPPRGLLARLVASFQLMASGLKKQVARRCSSLWKPAGSACDKQKLRVHSNGKNVTDMARKTS
jgi:hypothetical protein